MIRELKTFLAVIRHGTFAAAGERVGLTQSAVSAQIRRLEEALDVQLFERRGRSVVLNTAGRNAVEQAEQIVGLFDRMGDSLQRGGLRGWLRVGTIHSAEAQLLPQTLALLRIAHPHVSVRMSPGSSLYLLDRVDSGEIDVALMVRPNFAIPQELVWLPLLREPFVLITPLDEPEQDWRVLLARRPFVRYATSSSGGRAVARFLKQHQLQPQTAMDVEEISSIAHMVAQGLGVALIPRSSTWAAREDLRVISLENDTVYRQVGMLRRAGSGVGDIVAGFTECLLQVVRALPGHELKHGRAAGANK